MSRRLIFRVNRGCITEKEAVARHRVRNTRARENRAIQSGKYRDHDSDRNSPGRGAAVETQHYISSDPMARSDLRGTQNIEVGNIEGEISRDHRTGSENQSARQIALRLAYLRRNHAHVVPAVISP